MHEYEIYYLVGEDSRDFEHEFVKAESGQKAIRYLTNKYKNYKLVILSVKRKDVLCQELKRIKKKIQMKN